MVLSYSLLLGTSSTFAELSSEPSDVLQSNYVELIKNGNFDAGLDNWRAQSGEINCEIGAFWIETCDKQEEYKYGFPKYSVSDALSIGERYFVTQVPSFSEKGWFDWTWQVVTASALEQDIDVPAAKNILLSFKAGGYSDTQLEIYVKNRDDGTRTLFNQLVVNNNRYSFGDYIHRTYDMTSFAGKKITLIFVSKQISIPEVGAEDLNTAVYLDDISLIAEIPATPVNFSYDESMWLLIVLPIAGIAITLTAIKTSRKRHVIQTPLEIPQKQVLHQAEFSSEKISDETILVTGQQLTKGLQQKEPEEIPLHTQKELPKEEVLRYIQNASILQYLWLLNNTKEGFIIGQSEVVRQLDKMRGIENKNKGKKVPGSRREQVKPAMNELEKAGLVKTTLVKEDVKRNPTNKYEITNLGREYIEKAIANKITNWTDFLENYGAELYGK